MALAVHAGSIPSELGGLVSLENLNLGNNLLTGKCSVLQAMLCAVASVAVEFGSCNRRRHFALRFHLAVEFFWQPCDVAPPASK